MQAFIDLLTNFGVTWERLLGQILTFVLLVVILRLVMYKPILNMLEERKQRIAKAMQDVDEAQKARSESEIDATARLREATKKAETLLDEAKQAADKLKAELLDQTHAELATARQAQEKSLARAKEEMLAEVRQEVVGLVVATTTKVLQTELTKEQQQAVTKQATKELQ